MGPDQTSQVFLERGGYKVVKQMQNRGGDRPTLSLGLGGRLRRRALRAHGLSPGEGVQRPGVAGSRGAPQSGAARRRVDPAQLPSLQGAGEATSTAGLPQHLGASGRHRWTLAQLLRSTRGASDRLWPHHRGPQRPCGQHGAQRCHHDVLQI